MTAQELIEERLRCGLCPICGEDFREEFITYKSEKYGDMKVCKNHEYVSKTQEEICKE